MFMCIEGNDTTPSKVCTTRRHSLRNSIGNSLGKATKIASNKLHKKKGLSPWERIFEDDSDDSLLQELEDETDELSFNNDFETNLHRLIGHCRIKAGKIVENDTFQSSVISIIALNSLTMGIGTLDIFKNDRRWIEITDIIFLSAFTCEVCLKIVYLQRKFFTKPESVCDFLIVSLSWAYTTIRIFRTFLLFDRVKAFKFIVRSIASVYSGMTSILILIVILVYIYSVMTTTLYRDAYDQDITSENFFGRLDFSCFTLFQILSLDNWMDVSRELMAEYKSAWLVMVSYAIFSGVVLFNVFVAIFTDSLVELKKMKATIQMTKGSFRDLEHLSVYGTNLYVSRTISVLEDQMSDLFELHEKTRKTLDALDNYINDLLDAPLHKELPAKSNGTLGCPLA